MIIHCKKLELAKSPLFSGFFSSAAMISLNFILSFSLLDPHPLPALVFAGAVGEGAIEPFGTKLFHVHFHVYYVDLM